MEAKKGNEEIAVLAGYYVRNVINPQPNPADYHDNWMLLMSMVKRINGVLNEDEEFAFTFTIRPDYCSVWDNQNNEEFVRVEEATTFKELVWLTVVEFARLYNEKKLRYVYGEKTFGQRA